MILTKLQGGVGNQLFQWAVTKNLSLIYNTEYYFEMGYFYGGSQWNYELDKFERIKSIPNFHNPSLTVIPDDFHYKKIPDNSFLYGYWQSEKYFKENEDAIRNDIKISKELKEYIFEKYPILNEKVLSIHIRRGDYVNLSHVHPIQTIEYYKNAYDIINDNSINVMIFSDDIDWCKEYIKFNNISYITNETNIVDLYLMSSCTHHIIANSSFSWWGAWIGENKNKTVIAPKNWFGANGYNSSDIVPENWIKI